MRKTLMRNPAPFSYLVLLLAAFVLLFFGSSTSRCPVPAEPLRVPNAELSYNKTIEFPFKPYKQHYSFSANWLNGKLDLWRQALGEFTGRPNVNYLEIGIFEGAAALWVLENILTDPSSTVTGIDLFEGEFNKEHPGFEQRYLENIRLSGASNRITTIKGASQIELRKLPLNHYDIIFIDGSRENTDVLEDAVLSWRLLREGGVMILDDYFRRSPEVTTPKQGIDEFYRFFGRHFKVLHNDEQVILKKLPHVSAEQ